MLEAVEDCLAVASCGLELLEELADALVAVAEDAASTALVAVDAAFGIAK